MAKRVTQKEKEKMWQMYQQLGSFAKVAKKMRRNPDTVSRYVREYEAAVGAASYVLNRIQKGILLYALNVAKTFQTEQQRALNVVVLHQKLQVQATEQIQVKNQLLLMLLMMADMTKRISCLLNFIHKTHLTKKS